MQRILTIYPERFSAPLVIVSLAVGFSITFMLASIPPAQMPVSPDQWWMWCWAGFGAWYGLTIQLIRASSVRFVPLPLAGSLAFAVVQILIVTVFDSTTIALPYYLAPILPVAIFGGVAMTLFSRFVKQSTSLWGFMLLGCLSFGIGESIDFGIRDVILFPYIDHLNDFTITCLKVIAISCFGLCVGVGSWLAFKRQG